MGLGPIPAIRAVLEQAGGGEVEDIDAIEMNEAFAAQVLPCRNSSAHRPREARRLRRRDRLGHPFGMTRARIMTTLLDDLDAIDGTLRARVDVRGRRNGPGRRSSEQAQLANGHAMASERTSVHGTQAARTDEATVRVALVTGGTRRIGAAFRSLASAGAASSNRERADELRESIETAALVASGPSATPRSSLL